MGRTDSRILLPLRTSVDLFSDPRQPSALARAKQAAVLHDIVVIEVGFLDVSITEHGGTIWWTSPDRIRPDQIARARRPPEVGSPMSLSIGAQAGPGEPATDYVTAFAGSISMAYAAEWHSEVLAPLKALGVDFIEVIATGGGDISRDTPVGDAIRRQNYRDWTDRSLMPRVNAFERDFIYKSFNRDIAVAHDLGAVLQVSTLFEPMLQHHGWQPTGATALQITVPDLGALEWEQVLAFRAHAGASEAREMLREFERVAAEQEPRDAEHFLLKVSQQVSDGLLAALDARNTSIPRNALREAAKTLISFVPAAGPFIGTGITAAEVAATKRSEMRSGIAALMRLRRG